MVGDKPTQRTIHKKDGTSFSTQSSYSSTGYISDLLGDGYIVAQGITALSITSGGEALDGSSRINNYMDFYDVTPEDVSETEPEIVTGFHLDGCEYIFPQYECKAAASGGTDLSLVTTGEKNAWNSKQSALSTQTAYSSKGTSTKVPTITTNTLGQVTAINETNIDFPVSSVNNKTGNVTLNADEISDSSTTKKFTTSAQQTAWSGKMPGFSLNISHATAGNPREVKFVTIDYGNMTQYGAAYFRLSATSCHPDGGGYNYMVDIYIGCTYQGVVKCDVIKYIQSSVDQYSPGYEGGGKYFGDVFYVVDTDAKKVYFYILGGQYTSSDFTPAVKIGSTSLTNVQQHTGGASYYDTGTKVRANGCGSLVAIKSDIPSKTSQLTNDSGYTTCTGTLVPSNIACINGCCLTNGGNICIEGGTGTDNIFVTADEYCCLPSSKLTDGNTYIIYTDTSELLSLQELITLGGGLQTPVRPTQVNGGMVNDYSAVVNELNSCPEGYYEKFHNEGALYCYMGTELIFADINIDKESGQSIGTYPNRCCCWRYRN